MKKSFTYELIENHLHALTVENTDFLEPADVVLNDIENNVDTYDMILFFNFWNTRPSVNKSINEIFKQLFFVDCIKDGVHDYHFLNLNLNNASAHEKNRIFFNSVFFNAGFTTFEMFGKLIEGDFNDSLYETKLQFYIRESEIDKKFGTSQYGDSVIILTDEIVNNDKRIMFEVPIYDFILKYPESKTTKKIYESIEYSISKINNDKIILVEQDEIPEGNFSFSNVEWESGKEYELTKKPFIKYDFAIVSKLSELFKNSIIIADSTKNIFIRKDFLNEHIYDISIRYSEQGYGCSLMLPFKLDKNNQLYFIPFAIGQQYILEKIINDIINEIPDDDSDRNGKALYLKMLGK